MNFHIPVMAKQVVKSLITKKTGIYLDCTIGGGGHAEKIMEEIYPEGWLIGLDQDLDALEFTRERLRLYRDRLILVKSNFSDLKFIIQDLGFKSISGILFDLGISSYQVDTASRGFSFNKDNLLDMRMDSSQELDGYYVINHYSESELVNIFSKYGEERFSRSLARLIVSERKSKPIETTSQLAQLIVKFYARYQKGRWRIHPATKIFQAVRIEVNQELTVLEDSLLQAISLLEINGRVGVISYHSLEDRVVKHTFLDWNKKEKLDHFGFDLVRLFRKPLIPDEEEIRQNPRARSAKLRVAEKIGLEGSI